MAAVIQSAARRNSCLLIFAWIFRVCLLLPAGPLLPAWAGPLSQSSTASQPIISHIDFEGNRRIQRETLQARIFSRPGDPYSDEAARRDFLALWNTQYFEDIRLEVQDDPKQPNGKIVIFHVQERPIIRRIEYKGNKSVSESDILDRFKERKVGLAVESQFDPTKIKRAEVVLKDLLAEHGRQFATVKPTYERIAATNAVKLVFNIEEGPKVKVGKIIIQGNHAFSSRRIVRSMRHSRPGAIPLLFTEIPVYSKTYDRNKLNEDLEVGIRGLYQDNGYFKVVVKDPILHAVEVNRGGIPGPWPIVGSKHGKQTDITIPIEEGDRYRMGKLIVRSSDPDQQLFIKPEFLQSIFPLREGDIFSTEKIRKALDNYRSLYGEYGFIDFTATPLTDVDTTKKVVNLTLEFDQQKQFYVRRIEFTGNTTTRDKVIRREILIDEGQLFNKRLWEISLLRLNQLDYFDQIKPENAELKRNIKEGTVDILLKVKEKGKQTVSFTGGVSGIAGSFVGLSYQTNNFLGLGETLTFSVSFGNRQRNFLFGFTEPYLFDRPISTGFTLFNSRFDYNQSRETSILLGQQVAINPAFAQNYSQDQKGFTIFASYPLRRFAFTRIGLTYGWTTSNITAFSQSSQLLFQSLQFTSLAGPSALRGIHSSRVTPTISYSTVNSATNPTSGKSFSVSAPVEGGPLQGNVNAISTVLQATWYHPVNKRRNVVALRFIGGVATGYGGKVLPPFSRFYIGGEDTIRGFDFFTVSPWAFIPTTQTAQIPFFDPHHLDSGGNPILQSINVPVLQFVATRPGGDTQAIVNAEYRIPIAGPVTLGLFTDIGVDGAFRRSQLQLDASALNLLKEEYPNPDFPNMRISQRLQIAPGTNFVPRTSAGVEVVVQLPIVNAPFRFYYAYNVNRLTQTIVQPRGAFFLSDEAKRSLPPDVFNAQILPQLNTILDHQAFRIPSSLFEPKSLYRFTVSRTF
jgi:outer membrane protein insertion porin family